MQNSFIKPLKILLVLGFFLFGSMPIDAQSLLYEVSGKNLKNSVYLFGTIHAISEADFFIDDAVLEKLGKSDKVYFEVDMDSPSLMFEMQTGMMMNGIGIDQLLSESEYVNLKQLMLDSLGLPLDLLKGVKPMLMSSFFLPKIIGGVPVSYEAVLMGKAAEQNKEILGVETVAEQLSYIDSIPLRQQVEILLETVNDLSQARAEFQKLVELYTTRDIDRIHQYIVESGSEYKQFGEILLTARNKNWVPRIVSIANTHKAFIAVGAGHLGGSQGVVQLLRAEGYNVEPIQ